jgi:hypothetical protein
MLQLFASASPRFLARLEINARVERWTLDDVPLPGSWCTRLSNGFIARPLLSRNLEGQRSACGSFQPISSSACGCNHGRRRGPACLSQTLYRCVCVSFNIQARLGLGCSTSGDWSGARHAHTSGQKSCPGSRLTAKVWVRSLARQLAMSANGTSATFTAAWCSVRSSLGSGHLAHRRSGGFNEYTALIRCSQQSNKQGWVSPESFPCGFTVEHDVTSTDGRRIIVI